MSHFIHEAPLGAVPAEQLALATVTLAVEPHPPPRVRR